MTSSFVRRLESVRHILMPFRSLTKWLAAVCLVLPGTAAFAVDTYSGGVLTIPSLGLGNATLTTVKVKVDQIHYIGGPSANGSEDSYDPTSGTLTVQAVNIPGKGTFYNAQAHVTTLLSIAGVTGGDTYAGGTLSAPFVRVGTGQLYAQVVLRQVHVVSAGDFQMPRYLQDVYDPQGKQLTVAAIEVAGRVFTNAVITFGPYSFASYATTVPDVIGETESAAQTTIFGLQLGISSLTQQPSTTILEGNVVAVNPPVGTEVDEGTYVSLVLSSGSETLFFSFPALGYSIGADALVAANGSLYGTTGVGGNQNNGTIFLLTAGGTGSTPYQFPAAQINSYDPNSLILGQDGNFYGTTVGGGASNMEDGTVFQLKPDGTVTALWAFGNTGDGINPNGVIEGSDGNFYGTTFTGGNPSPHNNGVVFKVTPQHTESVLYTFGGPGSPANDGQYPVGSLVEAGGVFYGATSYGGANGGNGATGAGTVFAISGKSETILHSFAAAGSTADGSEPVGGLLHASNGNFYGMTSGGGANGAGTIYQISSSGSEKVVYSFPLVPSSIGGVETSPLPVGALIEATDGNYYGITNNGGTYNAGTVFRITPTGAFEVVHSFAGAPTDASNPSSLIQAADGNLYGTALGGGVNNTGAVFKVAL